MQFGVYYKLAFAITSAQCEIEVRTLTKTRRYYGQGVLEERLTLSPACAADDYEMTVVFRLRGQEIARDTMRFSVP